MEKKRNLLIKKLRAKKEFIETGKK